MNYAYFQEIESHNVFFKKLIHKEDSFRIFLTIALLYYLQNKILSIEEFECDIENQFKCIVNILTRQIHETYKLKDRYQRKRIKIEKILESENYL